MNAQDVIGRRASMDKCPNVGECALLSRAETDVLITKAQGGDRRARDKVIRANLRFVVSVALSYRGYGAPIEDLVSAGNLGLITAVDRYEPGRNANLTSYAVWSIRQRILKELSETTDAVKMPHHHKTAMGLLAKRKAKLEKELGRHISDAELLVYFSRKEANMLHAHERKDSSLNELIGESNDTSRMDLLISRENSPDHNLIKGDLRRTVSRLLAVLSANQRYVIESHYGFNCEALNCRAISRILGTTPSIGSHAHRKGLRNLREHVHILTEEVWE